MKIPRYHNLLFLLVVLFAHTLHARLVAGVSSENLIVRAIEPPNWWAGMQTNRIELLIYGVFPQGTEVTSNSEHLRVLGVTQPKRPMSPKISHHLFVEVEIADKLEPSDYQLTFRSGNEKVTADYSIQKRTHSQDRHQGFNNADAIYLITPDRFANGDRTNDSRPEMIEEYDPANPSMRHGGDLHGIIKQLPYLKELGITAVWLNPVLENNGVNSYHGYKATNLYRIDPRFGSNETYRAFVEEAHRQGIKVIFDHVSNHIGIRHPWVNDLPTTDWLNGTTEEHLSDKHYLLSLTDPHATAVAAKQLKTFWFVDRMPDLNQTNPHVARYLTQNMVWWIEFAGLDGIREDTYPYADQTFLANWAKTILTEYPQLNIVGEIWATKPAYIAHFQERTIFPRDFETHLPAVMDFPLMNAMRDFVSGKGKLRDVYEIYSQDFLYTDPDNLVVFLDNHDTPRVIFEAGGDTNKVKLALAILLTSRGIPQLLYGTEIGMMGGKSHVELRANFPGGFPDDVQDATTAKGRTKSQEDMFQFTKQLLQLRKKHPALTQGKLIHCSPTWNDDTYKYVRVTDNETILVVANGHKEARRVSLDELSTYFADTHFTNLLTGQNVELQDLTLNVAPHGVQIMKANTSRN